MIGRDSNISEEYREVDFTEYYRDLPELGDPTINVTARKDIEKIAVSHKNLASLDPIGLVDYRTAPKRNRNEVIIRHLFIVKEGGSPYNVKDRLYFSSYLGDIINFDKKISQYQSLTDLSFTIYCPLKLFNKEYREKVNTDQRIKNFIIELTEIKKIYPKWAISMSFDDLVFETSSYNYSVGCQHYAVACELKCETCGGFFGCRLCHDDNRNSLCNLEKNEENDDDIIPPEHRVFTKEEVKNVLVLDYSKTKFKDSNPEDCAAIVEDIEWNIKRNNEPPLNHIPKDTENSENDDDGFDEFIDEADHQFPRYETKTVKCVYCRTIQPFQQNCENCGIPFANYICHKCKIILNSPFYEDNYHCDKCKLCCIGNKELSYHCDKCDTCINSIAKNTHKCRKVDQDAVCAVCAGTMNMSVLGTILLPCDKHYVHYSCYKQLIMSNTPVCPICKKDIIVDEDDSFEKNRKMEALWLYRDGDYSQGYFIEVSCNQCLTKFFSRIQFFGIYRCPGCNGFNCEIISNPITQLEPELYKHAKEMVIKHNEQRKALGYKIQPDPYIKYSIVYNERMKEAISKKILKDVMDDISYYNLAEMKLFYETNGKSHTEKQVEKYIRDNKMNFSFISAYVKLENRNVLDFKKLPSLYNEEPNEKEEESDEEDKSDEGSSLIDTVY